MTTLYEPVCHGSEHAPVNAALLATVLEAFPGQPVSFCAEAAHVDAVRAIFDGADAAVRWKSIEIAPRVCENDRVRFGYDWRTVTQTLGEATRNGSTLLVACASTPTGVAALKCQLLLKGYRGGVVVVHHSAFAGMLASRLTRALLTRGNGSRIRHVVLGRNICRTVAHRFPAFARCLFGMRHPYLFPSAAPSAWPVDEQVRFGFLGVANQDKGFDAFCRLAARVARQCRTEPAPRFELVGRLASEYKTARPEGCDQIEMDDRGTPLPRRLYEQRVDRLTYAVLPYAPEHYALTSSGAILDAFVHVKPCIVLRNPLFEEYFDAMGDIGYLCDTEDQMFEVIREVVTTAPASRYQAQCQNILDGRRIFSPASVARELRSIVPPSRGWSPSPIQAPEG